LIFREDPCLSDDPAAEVFLELGGEFTALSLGDDAHRSSRLRGGPAIMDVTPDAGVPHRRERLASAVTDVSRDRRDSSLPFGTAAGDYDRFRFFPSGQAISWLLRGNERRALDLAAGTGQVTGQLLPRGLSAVAVEPDERMRAVFRTRFPETDCLEGSAERIPLPDDSLDAVVVGSAWHWFDAPAALAEISRVLHGGARLAVFATSADTRVGWVRDLFTDVSLRAQQRGIDSTQNVTLPSADFAPVEETIFGTSQAMPVAGVEAWFRTHSAYLKADEEGKRAMEGRTARVLRENFPGAETVEIPVMTLCWRTERLPR
jgi:SAM-dependent methyltransferase